MLGPDLQRQRTLTRRTLLATVGAGVAAGGLAVGWEILRDDPGPQTVRVFGGADNNRARKTALKVWAGKPRVDERGLDADYENIANLSSDQLKRFNNLFDNSPQDADLLIVDPEYLRGMVEARQLAEFTDLDPDWLVNDLGCIGAVADGCLRQDKVYAVPLNTDIPLLVFNNSMINPASVDALRGSQGSDFWVKALELARSSAGDASTKRILLTNGDNEGFTACLTELVGAFDTANREVGTLPEGRALSTVCDSIRKSFEKDCFRLHDPGDEETTFTALKKQKVAVARLWPSQCRNLTKRDAREKESRGATYSFVPIPGGVLGGQVMVVGRESDRREPAQELALYLAEAASQLQLNYNGGYVPTLGELYRDDQLSTALYTVNATQINDCVRRPSKPDYAGWSERWRREARSYLLA